MSNIIPKKALKGIWIWDPRFTFLIPFLMQQFLHLSLFANFFQKIKLIFFRFVFKQSVIEMGSTKNSKITTKNYFCLHVNYLNNLIDQFLKYTSKGSANRHWELIPTLKQWKKIHIDIDIEFRFSMF